jgi:hypothetical protein
MSLVAVNLAPKPACFQLEEIVADDEVTCLFSDPGSTWSFRDGRLEIALAAYGFELLELRPVAR